MDQSAMPYHSRDFFNSGIEAVSQEDTMSSNRPPAPEVFNSMVL